MRHAARIASVRRKTIERDKENFMPPLPQDPAILLSFINMKLRDQYRSLAQLCDDLGADEAEIRGKLASIGYTYSEEKNAFL